MPISGIPCDKEVAEILLDLRDKRKCRYVFFKIRRSGRGILSISFNKKSKRDATFNDFLREVPKDEPRYIVYDFSYTTNEGEKRDRLLFIFWSPDRARTEDKVSYSSTKSSILKEIHKVCAIRHVELTDFDELNESKLIEFGKPLREKTNSIVVM